MQSLLAFIASIGLLVAVHEWGHFFVARVCGVRVLRFSIGFGPRVWGWTSPSTGTEFVLSAMPLGGYVKMLERQPNSIPTGEMAQAFDSQSLSRRAAIVAAGPATNLLVAIVLYSSAHWFMAPQPAPVLPTPVANSLAWKEGWVGGEKVLEAGSAPDSMEPIRTFTELRWWLTKSAAEHRVIYMNVVSPGGSALDPPEMRRLDLSTLDAAAADDGYSNAIGWLAPFADPVLGEVVQGGRGAEAGLQAGDRVLSVNDIAVRDAYALRQVIAQSPEQSLKWRLSRQGREELVFVRPKAEIQANTAYPIGRIGVIVGAQPAMVQVQFGFFEGIGRGLEKTWEVASMSVHAMVQMMSGDMSVRHLSGPITIADYAGKSAAAGVGYFMSFLGLISVSVGVLNLLPLPVLDGGHLMYYLWEGLTGSPIPERWWHRYQRVGLALLCVMMSIALYNDFLHILG
jgi:regulator of sigma E protease